MIGKKTKSATVEDVNPGTPATSAEPTLLTPGMYAWVTPWSITRENDHYLVPTSVDKPETHPGGTVSCLVLHTEDGWYVGGDLPKIDEYGELRPPANPVAAEVVTVDVLDIHLPRWRQVFLPGFTPDPRPATAADHMRLAGTYSNRILYLENLRGHGNSSVQPELGLAEYHQRQARLLLDVLAHLPHDHPQHQREADAMARYLGQLGE